MVSKNGNSDLISVLSLIVAAIAAIVAVRSCTISEEQSERYIREIIFTATRDSENNLTIRQVSGSVYYLAEVVLKPYYSGTKSSLYRKGTPYVLELGGYYRGEEEGYLIPRIHKMICLVQEIENCESQKIVSLRMEYEIFDKTKLADIK